MAGSRGARVVSALVPEFNEASLSPALLANAARGRYDEIPVKLRSSRRDRTTDEAQLPW